MKLAPKGRRWLLGAVTVLIVLVLLFVIDAATGRFSLYGWQVPLNVRVVDATTGTLIHDATVSYTFSFNKQSRYEPVGEVAAEPIIRMTYCRAEGGLTNHLRGPAHPVPSMYRFEFSAAGFLPQRVEGTVAELVEDPRKPWKERFALRFPEVKLERLTR